MDFADAPFFLGSLTHESTWRDVEFSGQLAQRDALDGEGADGIPGDDFYLWEQRYCGTGCEGSTEIKEGVCGGQASGKEFWAAADTRGERVRGVRLNISGAKAYPRKRTRG